MLDKQLVGFKGHGESVMDIESSLFWHICRLKELPETEALPSVLNPHDVLTISSDRRHWAGPWQVLTSATESGLVRSCDSVGALDLPLSLCLEPVPMPNEKCFHHLDGEDGVVSFKLRSLAIGQAMDGHWGLMPKLKQVCFDIAPNPRLQELENLRDFAHTAFYLMASEPGQHQPAAFVRRWQASAGRMGLKRIQKVLMLRFSQKLSFFCFLRDVNDVALLALLQNIADDS